MFASTVFKFCERVENKTFCVVCLKDGERSVLRQSKCMARLLPYISFELILNETKLYAYKYSELLTCYICESRLRTTLRLLEAAVTGLKLVQLAAHHRIDSASNSQYDQNLAKGKLHLLKEHPLAKYIVDCDTKMDSNRQLSQMVTTHVLLMDLQQDHRYRASPPPPPPPPPPPAPPPRPSVLDDEVFELKKENVTITILDDDDDEEEDSAGLMTTGARPPSPARPGGDRPPSPARPGGDRPPSPARPGGAGGGRGGPGVPLRRKRTATWEPPPPPPPPPPAPPRAALSADDVDWEDKIPMDVITYIDATDPLAALPAPAAPSRPLGVIRRVYSQAPPPLAWIRGMSRGRNAHGAVPQR